MDCWWRGTRRKGVEIGVVCSSCTSNGGTLALPILEFDRAKTSRNSVSSCVACCSCGGERFCIFDVSRAMQSWLGISEDEEITLTLSLDSEVIAVKAQVPFAILVPFPIALDTGELLMTRTSAEAC